MTKQNTEKLHILIQKLLPLPLFLLVASAALFTLGGLLFFMYSIIIVVALKSPMAFLIVFALSLICIGFGLLSLHGFFVYKKYYDSKKYGTNSPSLSTSQKTDKTFKDYLTVQNISLVVLLVGAICAVASAALGAMNREKWVQATSDYLQQNGYYADVNYRETRYQLSAGINHIVVDLNEKNAVVIYTENQAKQSFVIVNGYEKYVGQISLTNSNGTLTVKEGQRPSLNGALEKLLFFMFDENKIEEQIKIYIPLSQKDVIQIDGEYIVAQTVEQ